jgi:hypothetical protein
MSDKNFKVKNGITIQGEVDTLIAPNNSGGLAAITLTTPTFTSSASGALSGSGTASWSSYPVNTYPAGNPYGIKTINGQKRVVMPNVANFENMPIGSTVTFSDEYMNNGVGGAPIQQTLTTTGLYDGNGFNIAAGNDTFTSDPGGNHTFGFSWTGTESAKTITADTLRFLNPNSAGSIQQQLILNSNKKIVLEKFEGDPTDKSATIGKTWTVPAGVYSIDATLIGGGGPGGFLTCSASSNNASGSVVAFISDEYYGGDTTIVYNGTTYTAAGGPEGVFATDTVALPTWTWFQNKDGSSSTFSSFPIDGYPGNRKPGRGGPGGVGRVTVSDSSTINVDGVNVNFGQQGRAEARSGNGFDGEERHFTIAVVPGTTMALSVGANGGDGIVWGEPSSNPGAIYIRYVK